MTIPASLERFQHELESAVARDVAGGRRSVRRRRVLASGVGLAAAAAVAFALVGVTWNDGGPSTSGVSPAQAVERARAALAVGADSILHIRMDGFQDNGDGTTASWSNELWLETGGSPASRSIEVGFDGVKAEQDQRDGMVRLYDASTNTIYVQPKQRVDASELKIGQQVGKLDDGTRVVIGPKGEKVLLKPGDPLPKGAGQPLKIHSTEQRAAVQEDPEDPFRMKLQVMLDEANAHEAGRVEIDGREAVRYVSNDGRQTYTFDAATGNPIEFTTTGKGGGTRLTFTAYEKLPLTDESRALLDLAAQHPDATIDRDSAHFNDAMSRLFKHG